MPYRILIFILLLINNQLWAQFSTDSLLPIRVMDINPRFIKKNDTMWIQSGICKPLKFIKYTEGYNQTGVPSKRPSFVRINGNVQYDFLYRSFADTPFYQKDFRQHTLRTSLTVYAAGKYPMNINFLIRKSNSPYFQDFFDGGLQFDKHTYLRNLKQELLRKISVKVPELAYLDAAKKLLEKQIQQYTALKRKLGTNGLAQQLIEEREKEYFKQLQIPETKLPGVKAVDSLKGELAALVEEKRQQLDSMQLTIDKLTNRVDSIQQNISSFIARAGKEINKAKTPSELLKLSAQYEVTEKRKKWERVFSDMKSIGIGRSVLDYSELTARNVSLTGINLEYNPKMYFAIAAGKIDYGFRDFFGRNNRNMNQQLLMGRVGFGNIEKRAIIFSVFTGRKANYGSVLSDSVSGTIGVTGYAIEAVVKKDEKTSFSVEVAKSTRPLTGRFANNKELGNLFSFSDQTNIGISANGQTEIEATSTHLQGMFRKTGENFQSFSLFTYNTNQTAYMLRAEQPLFKDRVTVEATVRKNDFVNPFTEKTFKTSTLFGSGRLSVRIHKWPSLSIGYHPGSQLFVIDRNRVRENVYYILNGSLVHQYKVAGTRMVSSAIYNDYTTRGTDSGFINYTGRSYMLSQAVYFNKLQLQGNFIYTDQQELQYATIEGNADLAVKTMLRIGAGIKYNKIIAGETFWGGTGQLLLDFQRLGSLQLQYEKSFLPTIQQSLFPVEMGRLTWFKTF